MTPLRKEKSNAYGDGMTSPEAFVAALFDLYGRIGGLRYGEDVSQLEHALQTAHHARLDGAPEGAFHVVGGRPARAGGPGFSGWSDGSGRCGYRLSLNGLAPG